MTAGVYSSPPAFKAALEQRLKATSKDGVDFTRRRQLGAQVELPRKHQAEHAEAMVRRFAAHTRRIERRDRARRPLLQHAQRKPVLTTPTSMVREIPRLDPAHGAAGRRRA